MYSNEIIVTAVVGVAAYSLYKDHRNGDTSIRQGTVFPICNNIVETLYSTLSDRYPKPSPRYSLPLE